jgi:hypothetical protein
MGFNKPDQNALKRYRDEAQSTSLISFSRHLPSFPAFDFLLNTFPIAIPLSEHCVTNLSGRLEALP